MKKLNEKEEWEKLANAVNKRELEKLKDEIDTWLTDSEGNHGAGWNEVSVKEAYLILKKVKQFFY